MNFKPLLTTLLGFFCIISSNAQYNRVGSQDFQYFYLRYTPLENERIVDFEQINYEVTLRRKKKEYIQKTFNESGRLTDFQKSKENSTSTHNFKLNYDSTGKTSDVVYFSKGKLKTIVFFERNSQGFTTLIQKTKGNGKILSKEEIKFDDYGNRVQSINYKKGGKKVMGRWMYEYNEEGSRARTIYLNSNGKIKHEWNFACDVEGEKVTKKHEKTQVCKWSEISEKYIIKITQKTNQDGEIRKYVSKYTRADTLILETAAYNKNDELISQSTYDKSFHKILTHKFYKEGVLTGEYLYKYEGNNLVKVEVKNRTEVTRTEEYLYENDLLVRYREFDKKQKLVKEVKLDYIL